MLHDLARARGSRSRHLRLLPSPHAHPRVLSEAGRLRRVLVHRPGAELARLTPDTMRALLFDDLPWPERAREEHDAFTDLLRSRGVEVVYLDDLLADVLANADVRRDLIDATLRSERAEPGLRRHLDALSEHALAEALIAGIRQGDGGLAPLPNQVFMRDSSAWLHTLPAPIAFAQPARRREA